MLLSYEGQKFKHLDDGSATWAELARVEKVTGLRIAQIKAMGQVCGCTHRLEAHRLKVEDDYTSPHVCAQCGCDDPMEDVPIDVGRAFLWISLKRVRPEMSFTEFGEIEMNAITPVEEDDPTNGVVNPAEVTTPTPAADDEPSTSQPSPN